MSEAVIGGHEAFARRQVTTGRTLSQGLFGIAAIILGIVGLAIGTAHPNVPVYLDAIAAIVLGLNLLAVGAGLTVAYGRLAVRAEGGASGQMAGMSTGMVLGAAVVVLGILALLRVATPVLIPVAAIVIGAGLILSSGASVRLAMLETELSAERTLARRVGEEVVFTTATMRAIGGIAVVILGILGLAGADVVMLTLAAMIVAGAALLNGMSMSNRMIGMFMSHRA